MTTSNQEIRTPGFSRWGMNPRSWAWGAILASVLVCAAISWIHLQQRRVLARTVNALQDVRQARIDLAKGFLHTSLAGDMASPFNRDQGLALLEQSIASLDDALRRSASRPAPPNSSAAASLTAFRDGVRVFRARLASWSGPVARQPELETELRIAFYDLERQADLIDGQTQLELQHLFTRSDLVFLLTLWAAALLLAGICGVVFVAGRAQQQSESALRESDERHRLVFERVPLPMWVYDREKLRFLAVNRAAQAQYGYGEAEFLAMTIRDIRPAEDVPKLEALVPRIGPGLVHTGEWRHRKKDGRLIWVAIHSHDIEFGGRNARIVLAENITERRRAEEALRESEERLRLALQGANQGCYDLNVETGEAKVSPEYATMLGYDPAEFAESNAQWIERLHPDDRAPVAEAYRAYIRGEIPLYHVEFRQRTKDGGWKWILSLGTIVARDQAGRPLRMLGTHTDLTRQKQMEADLRTMLEEKTTLLKEVHHRVKNNLQIITSLLNLQADRIQDPQVLDLLEDTRQRIRSMALLHESLYRSENLTRIDFAVYVEDLCTHILRASAGAQRRVQLRCHVDGVQLTLDRAIPCGLIINELVSNALKHAYPGERTGSIWVRMETAADQTISLRVADDGVGLPPGHESRRHQTLGLQLVNILTAQLQGTLQVESDRGTTFRVVFQAKRPSPAATLL